MRLATLALTTVAIFVTGCSCHWDKLEVNYPDGRASLELKGKWLTTSSLDALQGLQLSSLHVLPTRDLLIVAIDTQEISRPVVMVRTTPDGSDWRVYRPRLAGRALTKLDKVSRRSTGEPIALSVGRLLLGSSDGQSWIPLTIPISSRLSSVAGLTITSGSNLLLALAQDGECCETKQDPTRLSHQLLTSKIESGDWRATTLPKPCDHVFAVDASPSYVGIACGDAQSRPRKTVVSVSDVRGSWTEYARFPWGWFDSPTDVVMLDDGAVVVTWLLKVCRIETDKTMTCTSTTTFLSRFGMLAQGFGWALQGTDLITTSDGARTWNQAHHFSVLPTVITFLSSAEGFSIIDSRLHKTNDGGKSWMILGNQVAVKR